MFVVVPYDTRRPSTIPPPLKNAGASSLDLHRLIDQAVDTGAGMVLMDPPVTVATVVPMNTHDFFLQWKTTEVRATIVLFRGGEYALVLRSESPPPSPRQAAATG